jgi:hypothetical protein
MGGRQQRGSVGFIVIVAIIAAVAWWQRDRIKSIFSGASSAGAPAAVVAEVSGVSCVIQGLGDAVMSGTVKNVSGETQSLEMTARWDIEDLKPMYFYSPLTPASLPAGASTQFEVRGVLPQGAKGTCRVQAFTDRKTARPVGFR